MHKSFSGWLVKLVFSLLGVIFTLMPSAAQVITFHDVDPGLYTPGSTIAAPFKIDINTGACLQQNNVFNLYLSDANGDFTSEKLIGTTSGFYATFVNGTIPLGTAPGIGYKLRIKTTAPASVSAATSAIVIGPGTAVNAGIDGSFINTNTKEVFGYCAPGQEGRQFYFGNTTTPSTSTVTASFYDESGNTSTLESTKPVGNDVNIIAHATNYTIVVKAFNGASVSTRAYQLINNTVQNSVSVSGSFDFCLLQGDNKASVSVDKNKVASNYPGNIYSFSFGDGAVFKLSACQLKEQNYTVTHTYTSASCGVLGINVNNAFPVIVTIQTPYCDGIYGQPFSTDAKVYTAPKNKIIAPKNGCTGNVIKFKNDSYPGQNLQNGSFDCVNNTAQYNWKLDGVVVLRNVLKSKDYEFTATPGVHIITLELQRSTGLCDYDITSDTICIQDPPKPAFTVPQRICQTTTVSPENKSVLDNSCVPAGPTYEWKMISGPGTITYGGGTTKNSVKPQWQFSAPGTYQLQLSITSLSCDPILSQIQTIVVDGPPTAVMTANKSLCSKDVAIAFDPNGVDTKTLFTGTIVPLPDTYTWTVSGGKYEFANGTDMHTQYPSIIFHDNATYTISVTHKNECNTVTASQQLTFQDAPVVDPGNYDAVCSSDKLITLSNAKVGTGATFVWQTTTGGTFSDANSINPTYTFSAKDIAVGKVTLILHATTGLSGICSVIDRPVTITVLPQPVISSATTYARCSGQAMEYTITGNVPDAVYNWTATSTNVSGFTASGSGTSITDVLTANGTTAGTVVYKITPVAKGCTGNPFTLTVTVSPVPVASTPSLASEICTGQPANIALSSNIAGSTYTWTSTVTGTVTGNTSVTSPISGTSIADVLVNGSTTEVATITYKITVYNSAGCTGNTLTVTRTLKPAPVQAVISNPKTPVCNVTELQLKGNDAGTGTGTWTELTGKSVQFSDIHDPLATVKGLIPGNAYQFKWRIDAASGCTPTEDIFNLQNDKQSIGGTTSAAAPVCSGANNGTITLSGYTGAILRWESSTDNFATSAAIISTTNASVTYSNLNVTTYYRAVVQSGSCNFAYSTVSTVTVNPALTNVKINPVTPPCNSTSMTLSAVTPGTYTGTWTIIAPVNSGATIADIHNPTTLVNNLTPGITYTFRWTVSTPTCGIQSDEVTVTDKLDVKPSFTSLQTSSCGPASILFRNTSFGDVTTAPVGTSFEWYVDGVKVSDQFNLKYNFTASDTKDLTYKVELKITSNCSVLTTAEKEIEISPAKPVASLNPGVLTGCSPFTPVVELPLTGNNNKYYDYFITDLSTGVTKQMIRMLDPTPPVIDPLVATNVSKKYSIYLRVTDNCGNTSNSLTFQYTVSPADVVPIFVIKDPKTAYCLGETITLQNGTAGGTQYYYTITNQTTSSTETIQGTSSDLVYALKNAGKYLIKITAISACKPAGLSSANQTVMVYGSPAPNFSADKTTACSSLTVQFSNLTPADPAGTPAQSLTYLWDFGDKSTDRSFAPKHTYTSPGRYTVTLTATNIATGCADVMQKTAFVTVAAPPVTDFRVSPDTVISIPDYKFTFTDETTGAVPTNWRWTFGDGSPAEFTQNTTHTYTDTGRYTVTLTTSDGTNCPSTKVRHVRIVGVPGQLFVPNAFIPTSVNSDLRTFIAKGSGIRAYRLQIFNNYGQMIWESTQLNSKGEPTEGWDGTFKGQPVQQGVYIWQMSATFMNGNEWKGMSYNNGTPKRTGIINLIR